MITSMPSETALLEALIVNNPDLERLESLLDQFNIFEAIGAVRVEVRHSDFLAYLLNPNQNHGLEDAFVRRLLQKAISNAQIENTLTPIHLEILNFGELIVLREWQNIDILLLDERNQIAVIIENKISTGEHGDQLTRYRSTIREHYPRFHQICLFLTPEGEEPTDNAYIPIDYGMVAGLVENLVQSKGSGLKPDVQTLMVHYSQMLRRHIVGDSEIAEICRKIYRKHQRALDLIFEYRPDLQGEIQILLEKIIQAEATLELDHSSKSYIRFAPKTFNIPVLQQGQGWTRSGRILLFEFGNFPDRLKLSLIIGPGPMDTRQKLMEIARNHHPLRPALKALGKSFNTIYVRNWLKAKDYEEATLEDLEIKIKDMWDRFMKQDLPAIQHILDEQNWLLTN